MTTTLTGSITDSMENRFSDLIPTEILNWAIEEFGDELVVSTSFGIQSSVMLHMANARRPGIPVIWVDTGYLPEETYAYAAELTRQLDLHLKVYESALSPRDMESKFGRLWESERVEDLDLYDQIRKVEPMQRALAESGARGWISGLRAEQTDYRKRLPRVKRSGHVYRVYPILHWSSRDVYYYMQDHGLPAHPLFERGYSTVGDVHSSRPMTATDTHERQTRFRGLKQECGLHL